MFPISFCLKLITNLTEFTGIQPESAASGALIHFHFSFRANEMRHHFLIIAFRAQPLFVAIHHDVRIFLNLKETFSRRFMFFIHFIQFKIVKPYSPTPILADIYR